MLFIRHKNFWLPFSITLVSCAMFFSWQLGLLEGFLPSLPRPEVSQMEKVFVVVLALLLSLNAGLFFWQKNNGSCPVGIKRASGVAGTLGVVALICPACVLIPFTIFGLSISLAILGPFVPLLQILSLFLLIVSTIMMWPKK